MNNTISQKKLELFLVLLLLLCYAYFYYHTPYDNVNSRLNLIYSIVNDKTVSIDKYHENTVDKSFYKGHYFCDKPIGASLLGIPVFAFLKFVHSQPFISIVITKFPAIFFIAFFCISIPSIFLSVLLFRFLCCFSADIFFNFILTLAYSLGTLAFPYSVLFFDHQLSAALSFVIFYTIFKLSQLQKYRNTGAQNFVPYCRDLKISKETNLPFLLIGFLSGWLVITTYQSFVVVVLLMGYMFLSLPSVRKIKQVVIMLAAFALPVLLAAIYNYISFENIFAMGYSYESLKFFDEGMASGIGGVTYPNLKTLLEITLLPGRGILWLSPFLVFGFIGFISLYSKNTVEDPLESAVNYQSLIAPNNKHNEVFLCFLVTVYHLILVSSYYSPHGGFTLGPRHLVPMLPFFVVSIIFCKPLRNSKLLKSVFYGFVCFSIVSIFLSVATEPQVPHVFRYPFEFVVTLVRYGYVAKNFGMLLGLRGWLSILPLVVIVTVLVYLLLSALRNRHLAIGNRQSQIDNQQLLISPLPSFLLSIMIVIFSFAILLGLNFIIVEKAKSSTSNNFAQKHYYIGVTLNQAGMLTQAEKELKTALKKQNNFADAVYALGVVYHKFGKHNKAIACFEKTIKIKKEFVQSYISLSAELMLAGETEQALTVVKKGLTIYPNVWQLKNLRMTIEKNGDY